MLFPNHQSVHVFRLVSQEENIKILHQDYFPLTFFGLLATVKLEKIKIHHNKKNMRMHVSLLFFFCDTDIYGIQDFYFVGENAKKYILLIMAHRQVQVLGPSPFTCTIFTKQKGSPFSK